MLKVEFIGEEKIIAKLDSLNVEIHKSLLTTITRLSIKLQANIKKDKLSGQVLKTKTGTLRRSINFKIDDNQTSIVGRVGIGKDAAKYGVMHEYGFTGSENIKAHLRTIKQAFGKPIAPKQIMISSHARNVKYPEKSFMRTALNEMQNEIKESINKAIKV